MDDFIKMDIKYRSYFIAFLDVLGFKEMVFGKDKIPELARGLGKASQQFRKALDDVKEEINLDDELKG